MQNPNVYEALCKSKKKNIWNRFFCDNIAAKCTFAAAAELRQMRLKKLHRKPNGEVILRRNDMLLSAASVHLPDREDITQLHTRTWLLCNT